MNHINFLYCINIFFSLSLFPLREKEKYKEQKWQIVVISYLLQEFLVHYWINVVLFINFLVHE